MRFLAFFLLVALAFSARVKLTPAAQADQITSLPGLNASLNFDQFSGYLVVDPTNDRKIFYWFVESQNNPDLDPVVWWSNGGPGCSGLIGAFEELGPFRPQQDGSIDLNPYSWNKIANILFIEAPAGVGFSESNNKKDYSIGDAGTATDNYHAIQQFLIRFPQYQNNDFYLASESYGGHYGPTLGQAIVKGNSNGGVPQVNLKGLFIGNPLTNMQENAIGSFGTMAGHSLISKPTADAIQKHCFDTQDFNCAFYEAQAKSEIGNVDPYALDFPICLNSNSFLQQQFLLHALSSDVTNWPSALKQLVREQQHRSPKNLFGLPYDPCEENYVTKWLNTPEVIEAIHADPKLAGQWTACSYVLDYNMTELNVPMQPVWQFLVNQGNLKLVIFSGDDDTVCGSLGTQSWIFNMGWKQISGWAPWYLNSQVGGYHIKFQGFSFATVHTAGHAVPSFQPERALHLFSAFLQGKL